MKETKFENIEDVIPNSIYLYKSNQITQKTLANLNIDNRKSSFNSKDSHNNTTQNTQKILSIKPVQLNSNSAINNSEIFNSQIQNKSKLIILDSLDNNDKKEISFTKEKRFSFRNNSEANSSIPETPKSYIRKTEENIDKFKLDELNTDDIGNVFKKSNIITNAKFNNVNNIFVNITTSKKNDLSIPKNLGKEGMNNTFYNNMKNNTIMEEELNKTTILPKLTKGGKLEDKLNIQKNINEELANKFKKKDYILDIMKTSNSFIYNRKENPFDNINQPKFGEKSVNKIEKNNANIKNKQIIDNLKKYNNNYSSITDIRKINGEHFKPNNIYKNPFKEELEESKKDISHSVRKIDNKLQNSKTNKILYTKYNAQISSFINALNKNKNKNHVKKENTKNKENLSNSIKDKNSNLNISNNINNITSYKSININNNNVNTNTVNNNEKKTIGKLIINNNDKNSIDIDTNNNIKNNSNNIISNLNKNPINVETNNNINKINDINNNKNSIYVETNNNMNKIGNNLISNNYKNPINIEKKNDNNIIINSINIYNKKTINNDSTKINNNINNNKQEFNFEKKK